MKNDTQIFREQQAERLQDVGYLECPATPQWFAAFLKYLKGRFPDVACVEKVGPDSNEQLVFLPFARVVVAVRLRRELAAYELAAKNTKLALETLQ